MGLLGVGRRLLAAGVLLAALAPSAGAAAPLALDAPRRPVALLEHGQAWQDTRGNRPVEEVAADPAIPWQPTHPQTIYPLRPGQALWIRFKLQARADAERWYLEVPYASVDRITLYTQDAAGAWQGQVAGDHVPVADWPLPSRHPLLPLMEDAAERTYLVRVENGHSFSAPLSFASASWLNRHEQQTSLVLGIYFGLAALAALLAGLSAASLRDRAYALYALTVTLMGLSQAAMTGIAGLHLWPHHPAWNDMSALVLPVLAVGALLWFATAVVSLAERSLRLHRLMLVVAGLCLPAAAAIGLAEPSRRFLVMVPYIAIASTVAVVVLLWAARRGDRWGGWMLAGSLPVLVGASFPLARTAGLIPVSFWTMHGMQLGIAVELPVLLVMLMLRSQHRREHQRRMLGLDRHDPATGLINETVFREQLARLITVSQRLNQCSAVLLVDLANVEAMRRDFGPRAAEELPLRVAGRLLSAARDIDIVARLSPHRFGILMEGPLTAQEVAAAGPRLVARCLMPFHNKPVDWVARVRVAQGLIPQDGDDADALLAHLGRVLDHVPQDARRAVFPLARVA